VVAEVELILQVELLDLVEVELVQDNQQMEVQEQPTLVVVVEELDQEKIVDQVVQEL
tara:strand:- start:27 stop:197 length:171 start_codon:yes stop_codon:yes gene_type:complete